MLQAMAGRDPRPRRRVWAAAGTLLLHLAVFGWLAMRSEPPKPPRVELADVELWEIAVVPEPEAGTTVPPTPPASDPAPTDPAAEDPPPEDQRAEDPPLEDPRAEDTPPRARPGASEPAASEGARTPAADDGTPSSGPDEDAAAAPSGGLALSGHRRNSHAGVQHIERPTIAPPTHSRAEHRVASDAVTWPSARDGAPRSLAEAGFRGRKRDDKLVYKSSGFRAILHADGRITFRDIPRSPTNMPGGAEALRAASGQELYIKEKRELLEATYELRVGMAIDFAEKNIDKRLASLYREMIKLWHRSDRLPEDRRRLIFDRWDECEESFVPALPSFVRDPPQSIDEKRRTAGQSARDKIEEFVRTHLPRGSADAYSADELRQLNAHRRSRARFDPYRT
jgi:hypothetical protein